ncbi:hypothetical protein Brms1b_007544 [Colletotrichum noveboracense]|nr:hypothetical protein COL940_007527 [Colletotrichum noveboracense]KAJ0280834.1 hypothetical protein CBS470a_008589 [Colletotrichum nupharicola]KAJ0312907.1 hypothetical protein Brms1b_007544 [Colletotrichum noveboracense]
MSSSLPPDPYKILGVSKDAQLPEIRSAHRKLVLKCHPDKVQDPALKAIKQDEFQKVQQAYELLSDENERLKYDDNVKLAELRKEMAAAKGANTSAPRAASARTYDVNIRTAEPRADTFKTTTSSTYRSPNKMYSQYPSRSWDEEIHRSSPIFEEPRAARRAASYEKDYGKVYEKTYEKPSRQEEESAADRERRRRKEEERRIREAEKERQERKDRERAARKQAERAEQKAAEERELLRRQRKAQEKAQEKAEKEREKARKAEAASKKHRNVGAYVEDFGEGETYFKEKKSSSSKKREEEKVRSRSIPREVVREEAPPPTPALPTDASATKMDDNILFAAAYMDKSRRGPGLARAATYHESSRFAPPVAAPTPPAVTPFAAPPVPPMPAEDDARRSKTRRSSDSKRDKSSHKKSPAKEPAYNIVEASPTTRMPQYASAHSSPMAGGSPPKVTRATTFDTGGYSRPIPGLQRAQTFHPGVDDSRGRHRSRMQSQTVSEDSESEDEPRHSRRSHRKIVDDAVPIDYNAGRSTRYTVNAGRAVPVESKSSHYYRDQSPPRSRAYYVERPSMDRGTSGYSGFGDSVKTSAAYSMADVNYSDIPRSRARDPHYEYATGYA